MTATAGATLVRARARGATPDRAVVHLVPVLHSGIEPWQPALCGYVPRGGPWVLLPDWPDDRPCPLCAERAEQPPAPQSFTAAALAVRDVAARSTWLTTPGVLPDALRVALRALVAADPTDPGSPAVRRTDPATSRSGAVSSTLHAGTQRARLLHVFADGSQLNAWAAWRRTTIPATACYWKRVSELAAAQLIEPTGETAPGAAGEQQTVYRITDAGRAALHALWEMTR